MVHKTYEVPFQGHSFIWRTSKRVRMGKRFRTHVGPGSSRAYSDRILWSGNKNRCLNTINNYLQNPSKGRSCETPKGCQDQKNPYFHYYHPFKDWQFLTNKLPIVVWGVYFATTNNYIRVLQAALEDIYFTLLINTNILST